MNQSLVLEGNCYMIGICRYEIWYCTFLKNWPSSKKGNFHLRRKLQIYVRLETLGNLKAEIVLCVHFFISFHDSCMFGIFYLLPINPVFVGCNCFYVVVKCKYFVNSSKLCHFFLIGKYNFTPFRTEDSTFAINYKKYLYQYCSIIQF